MSALPQDSEFDEGWVFLVPNRGSDEYMWAQYMFSVTVHWMSE